MLKHHLKLTAIAFVLATSALGATTLPDGLVYSANEGDNSISEIRLGTGIVRTVKVPIVPHNIQAAPDGKSLLAVGLPAAAGAGGHDMRGMAPAPGMPGAAPPSDRHGETAGKLLVLDPNRLGKILATLPAGQHPAHVVTDPTGKRAFVTSSEDDQVTVVDIERKRVIAKIPTGASPHGLRPSPNGGELYVANVKDDSVSVIATASLKEVARIPVGRAPVQVAFTPDGTRVYVSLRDDNKVAIIDTSTHQVVERLDVGRNPIQVFATPDGREVYAANQGSETDPDNNVSVIDTGSQRVKGTITTGEGAHGVVVSNDGVAAFVTNTREGTVSAIDTNTQRVIATYRVGAGPNGITYRPAP